MISASGKPAMPSEDQDPRQPPSELSSRPHANSSGLGCLRQEQDTNSFMHKHSGRYCIPVPIPKSRYTLESIRSRASDMPRPGPVPCDTTLVSGYAGLKIKYLRNICPCRLMPTCSRSQRTSMEIVDIIFSFREIFFSLF